MKSFTSLKTVLFLFIAVAAFAAPKHSISRLSQILSASNNHFLQTNGNHSPNALGKKSAANQLKWLQIGSTHFSNIAPSGDSVSWNFYSRDTIFYNSNGNKIVLKTTSARSGWTVDSITYLDSLVYTGNLLVDDIGLTYDLGTAWYGIRTSYAYLNQGKSFVEIYYNWNSSTQNWDPWYKDSIVTSAPNYSWSNAPIADYSTLLELHSFIFDTTHLSWKITESDAKIIGECNDTTLTFGGTVLENDTSNTMINEKLIMIFNSSALSKNSLYQTIIENKNPTSGIYYVDSKYVRSFNANGYQIATQTFQWDSQTDSLMPNSKSQTFPDAYGNDTFSIDYYYSSSWDTNSVDRHMRIYDNNGNNIETVNSSFSQYTKTWQAPTKDVNIFAQINTPIIYSAQPTKKQAISVVTTANRIVITAPSITGLVLYSAAGKVLASVKQQSAGSLTLDMTKNALPVPAGICFAKVTHGNGQSVFKVSINKPFF